LYEGAWLFEPEGEEIAEILSCRVLQCGQRGAGCVGAGDQVDIGGVAGDGEPGEH